MVLLNGLKAIPVRENPGAGCGSAGCTIVTGTPAQVLRSIVCTSVACAYDERGAANSAPINTANDPISVFISVASFRLAGHRVLTHSACGFNSAHLSEGCQELVKAHVR